MIRTLVCLNADLASSIALRYVCQLARTVQMEINTIHVEEPAADGNPPGTGWVRRTWEKGLLGSAEGEISQLINAEKTLYPNLGMPKVVVGDREEEILRELYQGPYDLFAEGVLYSFKALNFFEKIHSKLYKKMPCPILLIKNLVSVQKAALLVEGQMERRSMVSAVSTFFQGSGVLLDLFDIELTKATPGDAKEPTTLPAGDVISDYRTRLEAPGVNLGKTLAIKGTVEMVGSMLGEYGMVVSVLSRDTARKSLMLELLSRIPSAVLLCWE